MEDENTVSVEEKDENKENIVKEVINEHYIYVHELYSYSHFYALKKCTMFYLFK